MMVRVVVVGGAGSVGRAIVEELAAQGKHEVIVWTRRGPSELQIPNVQVVQVTDYTDKAAIVTRLEGTHTVLAFFNPMSDPGSRNQKALIDACVEAKVKRFAPSEWAGKVRSGIAMYSDKEGVLDYLEEINKEKPVLEWGLFQPGLLMDYFAHPYPAAGHMNTFPLLFDLLKGRAIIVEDGLAPMGLTAARDVGKVVSRAIDSEEPWPVHGGIVGEKTNMIEVVRTAERITGKTFALHHVKASDLRAGEFRSSWIPTFNEALSREETERLVIPFISGWALGIYDGIIDMEPEWNQRCPDLKFMSVEEMLRGAWEKAQKTNQ